MSWAKYYTYTPDATKAGSADSSNFTSLVKVTHDDLRTISNGGLVNDGTKDIAFYSDTAAASLLKYERVFYDGVNGTIWAWVKQATLSHTAGIPFYMFYGNAAIGSDLSDPTNAWNTNLKGVYHFGDGTTLSLNDSTANANHMTNIGVATAGTSPVGGAVVLNGSTQYLKRIANAAVTALPFTVSALFNPTGAADAAIAGQATQAAGTSIWEITQRAASQFVRATQLAVSAATTTAYTIGAWNDVMARFISSTSRTIHLNGAAGVNNATNATPGTPDDIYIGGRVANSVAGNFLAGSVAEVRMFAVDPGTDWMTAQGNSLLSPSTFLIESGPTTIPPVTPTLAMAVDLPTTASSGLGLYKQTSGNVVIAGGVGGATFSGTQAGKFCIGMYVKLTAAFTNYIATTFDGTTGLTLYQTNGSVAPDTGSSAFVAGGPIAVQGSDLVAGVAVTASIKSGSGTLAGTLTRTTDVNGNAIFGDLRIVGSGAHVLTFTAAGYTSIDSSSCTVTAAYATLGDFIPVGCYQETTLGLVMPFKLLVPTAAVVGTPGSMVYSCGGTGTQGTDAATGAFMNWGMGNDVTTHKGSVTDYYLFVQIPPGGNEVITKVPWRAAVQGILQLIVAAGYNINLKRIDYYGYSMGGVNAWDMAYMWPRLWRTVTASDGVWNLIHLTAVGSGVMHTQNPPSLQAAADILAATVGNNMGLYGNCGDPAGAANDQQSAGVSTLFSQLALDGLATATYDQVTQTVATSDRRVVANWQEATHTTWTHSAMDDAPSRLSNTNWQNWRAAQIDGLGLFPSTAGGGGSSVITARRRRR